MFDRRKQKGINTVYDMLQELDSAIETNDTTMIQIKMNMIFGAVLYGQEVGLLTVKQAKSICRIVSDKIGMDSMPDMI